MIKFILFFIPILVVPASSLAQLQVSKLISDGAVIQRDISIPIWGWSAPNERVSVEFGNVRYETTADQEGSWKAQLPALSSGGPFSMTIRSGNDAVRIKDLVIGDVWIASGQSNMEWMLRDVNDAEMEVATATDENIRHFKVPRSWSENEESILEGGVWERSAPNVAGEFSAVGYFFARELRKHVGVPVGIINTTWGGSRIEPWMNTDMLGLTPAKLKAYFDSERAREEEIKSKVMSKIGILPDEDNGLVDGEPVWAAVDFDDSKWFSIPVPARWEAHGFNGMDGTAWYRTTFDLSAEEASVAATLGLGMIDDSDIAWVNGVQIGSMDNSWNIARIYDVPSAHLQEGSNVLTVRVEDFGWAGGIAGPIETVFLQANGDRRPLDEVWKFMVGKVSVESASNENQVPTLLWNKMVAPLVPVRITGVIWYQGESNARELSHAEEYSDQFKQMIQGWREVWRQGDFPFLWAQLANYMAVDQDPPSASNWAQLRESQSDALTLPNTGEAILIDIGQTDDIHPRNKQDVGKRLSLAARRLTYNQDVIHSGPVYRTHEISGSQINVYFDHMGSGLQSRGTALKGFAIAGADGRFVWADATVRGNHVAVQSDDVSAPVAVRYAWGDNPIDANLYNAEGLPATPFRTDNK